MVVHHVYMKPVGARNGPRLVGETREVGGQDTGVDLHGHMVHYPAGRPPDVDSLLRRCAIAVVLFVSMQTFFSSQWWQWIAVLLVPLAGRHRWLVGFVVAHDLLTYLHFPLLFDAMGTQTLREYADLMRDTHVWARALLWAGLLVMLIWYEGRKPEPPAG